MQLLFRTTVLFLLTATLAVAGPPRPAKSKYLVTTGGGFMVEEGAAFYAMNFEFIKEPPSGYHLKFLFENPRKKQPPLTGTRRFEIKGERILVQSELLECIRNDSRYLVTVEIYEDESETDLVGRHKQKIEFSLPQSMVEGAGLTEC